MRAGSVGAVVLAHTRIKRGRSAGGARLLSLPVGVAHYPDTGWRSLNLSAPGSPCIKARTADASNTGLLAFFGFTRRLRSPVGDQLVRKIHALWDILAQESPGAA